MAYQQVWPRFQMRAQGMPKPEQQAVFQSGPLLTLTGRPDSRPKRFGLRRADRNRSRSSGLEITGLILFALNCVHPKLRDLILHPRDRFGGP